MRNSRNPHLRRAAERRAIGGLDTIRDRQPITVASIGGQQTLTLDLDAEARGYAHSAVAYRCVEAIASNGASVDLIVQSPNGDPIGNHPVAHLFNKRPNPSLSARLFKSLVLTQLELAGQAFVYVDRGETGLGDPVGLYPIYDAVQVIVDKPLADRPTPADITGFIVNRADGQRIPVLPEEMLWLRYPAPFDPLAALPPWKAARHAVDMDAYAREWQRNSYKNGATPNGVVYLGEMNDTEFSATKAAWRSGMQGPANAGKNLLVRSSPGAGAGGGGKGIGYQRITLTAEEMDYLESRMANAEEVMLAFGVPKDYLLGGATYENRTASKATLWSDTIKGKLDVIASEIDRLMLPSDAEDATWDYASVDALQDSQDSVANRTRALVYSDTLTIDEAREEVGRDPLPGGLGKHTLSPYRAQFAPVQGIPAADTARSWDIDLSRLPASSPDVGTVVERAVEAALARILGAAPTQVNAPSQPRRLELTRADDAPSSPSLTDINNAYDQLEASARTVVRALAKEQRERVLRDFDRLMKKPERSAAWLTEVRTEACALAREQGLTLAPPDLDIVPAACASELDVAAGPDGWEERIRVTEIFQAGYWRRRTRDLLRPIVERAWRRGGASITASFDLDEPDVAAELDARLEELAGQVTATTEQVLRSQLLAAGVAEGESIPQLRARIQRVFTDLSDYRATRIARTESVGGYSAASHMAALDAGAVRKTWLATSDARTREMHRQESGRSVAMNKKFLLTKSRWPADPAAPANQSIQCRCALTYEFEEN